MINKKFSERLNKELDSIGVPTRYDERVKAFSKIFHINPFRAKTILEGHFPTDESLLKNIAEELEINIELFVNGSIEHQKENKQFKNKNK